MSSTLSRRLLLAAAILAIGAGLFLFANARASDSTSDARTIGTAAQNFQELSNRFKELADTKGAVYAYQVLSQASLPPNTDLHLLGHTVGDELYKQKGPDGIADCTPDFRNACSHAIVIGTLNEYGGTRSLEIINEACKKAPGGSGAYTMCYHGLGHGVFAFYGYDLGKTVDFCRKTGTEKYHNEEYVQCIGGSIMELISGGGHDKQAWAAARLKYFDPKNPLAPCSSDVIPTDAKGMCYVYLAPYLFEAAGANMALPLPKDFTAAFTYCDRISKESRSMRQACFGGIGKEFPVLAMMRDIRNVSDASTDQLQLMREWCALSPHSEAYDDCIQSVVASLFWGGENDPKAATSFCRLAESDANRKMCFDVLFEEAAHYLSSPSPEAERLCTTVPKEFTESCRSALPV